MEVPNEFIRAGVSLKRNGSLSCPIPSHLIENFSRKSFSYNKLPQEPLTLTVVKLDGSSFDIEVPKTGRVEHLKQGVEAAFSHLPKTGPGTVSWPHVWGHFCLSYNGQNLLNDGDHIVSYGIKDGDKLHFVRHVSHNGNMMERLERDSALDESTRPERTPSLLHPHQARHPR